MDDRVLITLGLASLGLVAVKFIVRKYIVARYLKPKVPEDFDRKYAHLFTNVRTSEADASEKRDAPTPE